MSFNAPYAFQVNGREVVVQHAHNGTVRVSPQNLNLADGGGGTGAFARWKIHLIGAQFCRLQSVKTGKYLRILRNGQAIDVNGGTGQFTKFKIRRVAPPNGIMLESDVFAGRFIAVNPQRGMKIGSGGPHCKLWIKREGNAPNVSRKPAAVATSASASSGAFGASYLFQRDNTVVIRSNYGKHLRLHPHNNYNADGNGGHGAYAQWRVILDGPSAARTVKLQSTFNQKYLRIEQNGAVNVGGTGGALTRFRYHVHTPPNGVKLESVQFPGKYVAIRPDGTVCCGMGGVHTQLTFLKQSQSRPPSKHVCAQPVSSRPVVQPVVIVQPVPVASMVQQQQQRQQREMEQAMRQQQQQMENAMKLQEQQMEIAVKQQEQHMLRQQQEMEQQMERMRLQHEAQQQKVMQTTESQRMLLEQQVQQQMEQQQEGVPVVPVVAPVVSGTGMAYPVLNPAQQSKAATQGNDDHKHFQAPPLDIAPDDAIFAWLSTIDMQQYYMAFIKNGYDAMQRIAQIKGDHLSKMGIALGHQSIILAAAAVTAPLMKQRVRLKSVKYGTFVHEYGKPKDHPGNGKRCWLQHNEKWDRPGAIWHVELVSGYTLRLKHAPTGSWLRVEHNGEAVDTRSPLTGRSDLLLEQDETGSNVYYLKEKQDSLYVKCESPRALGRNVVSCTKQRDDECKFYLQIVK